MSTISEGSSPSSVAFSSSSSSPIQIQLVSKSKSERLLEKFYDSFNFELEEDEHEQWSTSIRAHGSYDVGSTDAWTEEEMVEKLRRVMVARGSKQGCHGACFHVWGSCISIMFVAIFKKRIHRHMKEITNF